MSHSTQRRLHPPICQHLALSNFSFPSQQLTIARSSSDTAKAPRIDCDMPPIGRSLKYARGHACSVVNVHVHFSTTRLCGAAFLEKSYVRVYDVVVTFYLWCSVLVPMSDPTDVASKAGIRHPRSSFPLRLTILFSRALVLVGGVRHPKHNRPKSSPAETARTDLVQGAFD